MFITKDYQTLPSLQDKPNLNITQNKLFSLFFSNPGKYKTQEYMAKSLGLSRKTINKNLGYLHDLGLLIRESKNIAYRKRVCKYFITAKGYYWQPYLVGALKLLNKVFLSIGLLLSAAPTRVTLVKLSCITEGISSLSYRELQTAPEPATPKKPPMTVRKEVTVSKEHPLEIPKHVLDLTNKLSLTLHGQCKLAVFNQDTIDYAIAMIKQSQSKSVFKDILEQCISFAKANDFPVDWSNYYKARDAGLFKKDDYYTSKKLTVEILKGGSSSAPKKDYVQSDKQAQLMEALREKSRQRQKEWEAKQNPERLYAMQKEYLPTIEGVSHSKAPEEVSFLLGVEEQSEVQWSQTEQELIDWCLQYMDSRTRTKYAWEPLKKEILLGPNSPRAKNGVLMTGLRLMRKTYDESQTKIVTEVEVPIVLPKNEQSDSVWDDVPLEQQGDYDEVY